MIPSNYFYDTKIIKSVELEDKKKNNHIIESATIIVNNFKQKTRYPAIQYQLKDNMRKATAMNIQKRPKSEKSHMFWQYTVTGLRNLIAKFIGYGIDNYRRTMKAKYEQVHEPAWEPAWIANVMKHSPATGEISYTTSTKKKTKT